MSVEGGQARGGGAFSSTAEVWDGGWRAVIVCGCLLRSLLKPILSVTAGGSGERWRPVEETERKSMELLETILLLGTTLALTQLSWLSPNLSIPQLDPSFFSFISTLHLTVHLSFLTSHLEQVSLFYIFFLPGR